MFSCSNIVKSSGVRVVSNELLKTYVNQGRLAVIDDYDEQDFNINEAGWIRNDISQLARAQSQAEYDAIMKRLVQRSDDPDDGLTDEEKFAVIKPRYCQSYNDVVAFADKMAQLGINKLHDAYSSVEVPHDEFVESEKSE